MSDFADDARWLTLIARLGEPERRIIEMRFLERRPLSEIASHLDISPAEVVRRLLAGARRLRAARRSQE